MEAILLQDVQTPFRGADPEAVRPCFVCPWPSVALFSDRVRPRLPPVEIPVLGNSGGGLSLFVGESEVTEVEAESSSSRKDIRRAFRGRRVEVLLFVL